MNRAHSLADLRVIHQSPDSYDDMADLADSLSCQSIFRILPLMMLLSMTQDSFVAVEQETLDSDGLLDRHIPMSGCCTNNRKFLPAVIWSRFCSWRG